MQIQASLLNLIDDSTQSPAVRRSIEERLVDQVRSWIDTHLDEDIGWDRLICISGVPAPRLQQMFQRCVRTTPMMYIRAQRIAQSDLEANAEMPEFAPRLRA